MFLKSVLNSLVLCRQSVNCVRLTVSVLCLLSAARIGLLSEQQRLLLQQHQLHQLLSSQPSVVLHTHTHYAHLITYYYHTQLNTKTLSYNFLLDDSLNHLAY